MYLEKFSKRLKELMELEGLSVRALSLKINVERRSIRLWLAGKFFPRYDALIKLSVFFGVRIDYLLGRDDTLIETNRTNIDIETIDFNIVPIEFGQKFSYILRKYNLTRYAVSKNLNVDAKSVSKWLTGKSVPETVNLIKLANMTDLSVDELLGQEY